MLFSVICKSPDLPFTETYRKSSYSSSDRTYSVSKGIFSMREISLSSVTGVLAVVVCAGSAGSSCPAGAVDVNCASLSGSVVAGVTLSVDAVCPALSINSCALCASVMRPETSLHDAKTVAASMAAENKRNILSRFFLCSDIIKYRFPSVNTAQPYLPALTKLYNSAEHLFKR